MIYLYKILGLILIPLIKINTLIRINYKKEIKSRFKERYGISKYKFNNNKKIIWIHAASLGEFKSADYFIKNYNQDYNILVTTTTVSAAKYAIDNYGKNIIHQFAPLDIDFWVKKFLNHWKPVFIIWIESDLWPITLENIKKRKIKAILVNLKLSPKSFKRWKIFPSFYNTLLDCFYTITAQSIEDRKRIKKITKRNIEYIGNLKLTSLIKSENNSKFKTINNNLNYKFLMLTSTHAKEENLLLPSIKKLLVEFKNLRIIIAPRHPERSKEIISLCSNYGISSQLYSKDKDNFNQKILIIDTFGMLSNYFNISDIVFLGGSLISAGGHNPIEPSVHKCAILTASYIFNWKNIFDDMLDKNACIIIESFESFESTIKMLLNDNNMMQKMKNNSFNFSQKKFVDIEFLNKIINDQLKLC